MRSAPLLDASGAHALSFAWLRAQVAPAGDYGEREFSGIVPFVPGQEAIASQRARRIAGLAAAADAQRLDAVRETLRNAPDAAGAIARASMGGTLTDAHLLELQRFGDAVARVDALLEGVVGVTPASNDAVAVVARQLELGRAGKFGFYLADGFDGSLTSSRDALTRAQAELDAARGRAVARVAAALGRDDAGGGDEFIVMRADLRGALPEGVRVLREAPTYFLCALEYDEPARAALQRRDDAAEAVAAAEEAVRAGLSAAVRAHAAALDAAARALGEIDVLVAAARFTQRYDCTVPQIEDAPALSFTGARFLALESELELEGREFTPIDVDLHDVAVLTGPNMGGKSVCLRTSGLVALCAAFGLPVPAVSARVALFDEIAWLGIGSDDDELGGLLSSFAKEVVRLRDVLARGASRLCVLVDEFARTTTPHEGKALTIALIERLRARGACGLIATHLSGVARDAGARHFAVRGLRGIPQRPPAGDLHDALAALAESMDYTIAEVTGAQAQGSDALALAALLGLDATIVADAYKALEAGPGERGA